MAEINYLVSKNNQLWDLSLTGGYGSIGGNQDGGSSNNWHAGVTLNVPIRDLSIRQELVDADIHLKKLRNDLARRRENLEIEVDDALRNAEMGLRQIRLAQLSRRLSEQKVAIETEKLKAGRSTNFQLLSFQNDLVNAQNNELEAVTGYLNALTEMERVLGITLQRWEVTLDKAQ